MLSKVASAFCSALIPSPSSTILSSEIVSLIHQWSVFPSWPGSVPYNLVKQHPYTARRQRELCLKVSHSPLPLSATAFSPLVNKNERSLVTRHSIQIYSMRLKGLSIVFSSKFPLVCDAATRRLCFHKYPPYL